MERSAARVNAQRLTYLTLFGTCVHENVDGSHPHENAQGNESERVKGVERLLHDDLPPKRTLESKGEACVNVSVNGYRASVRLNASESVILKMENERASD